MEIGTPEITKDMNSAGNIGCNLPLPLLNSNTFVIVAGHPRHQQQRRPPPALLVIKQKNVSQAGGLQSNST